MSKRSQSSSSDDNEDGVDNKDRYNIERSVQNRVSQLEKYCEKLNSENKRLKSELRKAQSTKSGRLSKGGMRTENEWSGHEANLSDRISSFCGSFLFRRYKFLKDGWETYNPGNKDSLSSFFERKIPDVNRNDYEDQWDRIYVPTIASKYKSLRCNLNNSIREQYKG
jgi:hypothetical protein